ncbi:hypothetical protein ACHAWT_011003 [Skeletonema menzelii]
MTRSCKLVDCDAISCASSAAIIANPQLMFRLDDIQVEAKRIFDKICPDADFLGLSKKVEDEIVYRNEEDSDDEKVVLDSAVTMIEARSSTPKTPHQKGAKTTYEEQPIAD